MLSRRRRWILFGGALAALVLCFAIAAQRDGTAAAVGPLPAQDFSDPLLFGGIPRDDGVPTYLQWMAEEGAAWKDADPSRIDGEGIVLEAKDFSQVSDAGVFSVAEGALLWSEAESWIEWEVDIPGDGLYEIGIVYDAANDRGIDIVRGLQIDGAYPFAEAETLQLKREFAHTVHPPQRDEFNNDIRPGSREVRGWKSVFLADYSSSAQPLKWPFTKGKHTVRLIFEKEPMLLKALVLAAPRPVPAYADVAPGPAAADAASRGNWLTIVEAEHVRRKSNASIQLHSFDSPRMSPEARGFIRYNAIGGEQFRKPGEWIEWEFEVPKDGYYEIGFRYLQAYLNQSYAFRNIEIDGKVPFREMYAYPFPYSEGWQWSGIRLTDGEGNPYLFYLTAGRHTIRVTATSAAVKPVYEGLIRNLREIGELEQQIRKITGNYDRTFGLPGNVDTNRDWDLEKYIPDLRERLQAIRDNILHIADYLQTVTIGTSDTENAFRSAADDLLDLKNHPRTIANRMNVFQNIQNNLATWTYRLLDQSLAFDYLWIAEPGAELPRMTPSAVDNAWSAVLGLVRSFVIDYDAEKRDPDALEVWVNRGRDYVELLRRHVDEYFTPQTGIRVNVNLVPDPQMLVLGNVAGIAPDVALGVDMATPVNFASRGALLDLSRFPDYEEAAAAFHPGTLSLFHYDGKEYALPELQGFSVLAYRTDILGRLGLAPPDTWEELAAILPTLQQNGYDFYVPPSDFLPFIYQHGAEFYTRDGMQSALDSEEAFRGFEQWTRLFSHYQLPKQVPSFYTHFRLGDIPIGVIDFNTYLQIQYAAPELAGKWAIAPLPGRKRGDGTVVRWAAGPVQAGMIFGSTDRPEEAWAFLKWWTSAEEQSRFGNEIEAMFGSEFRWNTANLKAFGELPWPKEDLQVIREQWKWFKSMPQVPGGYFTARMLDFAWQSTVLLNENAREAFEEAVIDINREMARKQIEFGLRDKEGNILHRLDVPYIDEPWEGGAP